MRPQRRSPPPRRALAGLLLLAACGCTPTLGGQDCERDLDCRGGGEVCAAGRCVPRGSAGATDSTPAGADAHSGGDSGPGAADARTSTDARPSAADADPSGPDVSIHGPDALIHDPDALIHAPDALIQAADALIQAQDALIHAPDALIHRPDAGAPTPDAFFPPTPDAFFPPTPDAFTPPVPDAFTPPVRDAFVPPTPDAFLPPPLDAFVISADAARIPDLGIVLPIDAQVEDARVDPDDGVSCHPEPERCDEVDNDCNGAIDDGPIAACAAPNADAFCVVSGCGPLICHESWFDLNGERLDGCERGCDPAALSTVIGTAGLGFAGRPALATAGRQWAAALVEQTPLVVGHRLTLVRDGRGLPVVLEDGDLGLGTPAIARTPNGYAVAVRSVGDWQHPIRVYWVPDLGQISEASLAVNAQSDPSVLVAPAAGANGPQLYMAWAGPPNPLTGQATLQWTSGPAENPAALGEVRTTDDLQPPTAAPVLYEAGGRVYMAGITDKQGTSHLGTWALGDEVGTRVGSTPLEGRPLALAAAVRGTDVLFGLTPERGGEARIHLGVVVGNGVDFVTPGLGVPVFVRAASPGDVAVAATDAGFMVALDVTSMAGQTDTEMRFVVDDPLAFELARAGADLTAGASAHMTFADAPQGLLAAWIEPSERGAIYVLGPANCR